MQQAKLLFAAHRLMARGIFSLNWQDIPEYFEDHMKEWMAEFFQFLSYDNALLRDADEEDEAGPIETLQAAIVENLKLYAEKYEEEFQPFLSQLQLPSGRCSFLRGCSQSTRS